MTCTIRKRCLRAFPPRRSPFFEPLLTKFRFAAANGWDFLFGKKRTNAKTVSVLQGRYARVIDHRARLKLFYPPHLRKSGLAFFSALLLLRFLVFPLLRLLLEFGGHWMRKIKCALLETEVRFLSFPVESGDLC